MDARSEDTALASTATPSPVAPSRARLEALKEHYFRLDSVTSLTAPLDAITAARLARARSMRMPENLRPLVSPTRLAQRRWQAPATAAQNDGDVGEEKLPIPDNPKAWAQYGFLDESFLMQATGQSLDGGRKKAAGTGVAEAGEEGGGGANRSRVRGRTSPPPAERSSGEEAAADGQEGERHYPSASSKNKRPGDTAARAAAAAEEGTQSEERSSTPSTDAATPSTEERRRTSQTQRQEEVGGGGGNRSGSSTAGATGDLTSSAVAAAQEEGETKEDELAALRQQEAIQAATAAAAQDNIRGGRSGSGGRGRTARTSQAMASEIERNKRNRSERLRAYGYQRTLYPRIVPAGGGWVGGGGGGGTDNNSGAEAMETDEAETEEWVSTLRVSAAIRGESLMAAAASQGFKEQRAATMREEEQLEARASRTADVSAMEGPDGLLHCAVLKGHHALAARAAQFLVDKRGSDVNSRDEWGRTPLHTAAGKGMIAMARFFIRRGANVDALDQDDRTPLFFACASGNTTMARYLTRIEIGARYDLKDRRGHLAGEYFWDSVEEGTRAEIVAILVAAGWPDPPPPSRDDGSRGGGLRKGKFSKHAASWSNMGRSMAGGGGGRRYSEGGGEAGMKRLASDMKLLMQRR